MVAIDGPAGAGKSTVAKLVAKELGLHYLDTGAMYRCVALLAQRLGILAHEGQRAADVAKSCHIEFGDGDPQSVLLNGEDVTQLIRTPELSELASALSAHSDVRAILAAEQIDIVNRGGCVLEGRDTTSVTAKNAEVKIFLTASLEERAIRRQKELEARGMTVDYSELLKQIAERDHRDYTRADSPLTKVPDAHVVETFGLTPAQVAEAIVRIARSVTPHTERTSHVTTPN